MLDPDPGRRRVAVVTGGGGGIGAAVAEELARRGAYVVTVDPLVSLDGTQRLPDPQETTAARIVASGGRARASAASVTDPQAIGALFAELAEEFDGLDAVVNVAGITRPTSFATGTAQDWRDVLSVHLDGYLNVLTAALGIMAEVGRGHVLGVTSGSGWRSADAGAYSCAKRAVASLTWEMGRHAPPGVVVNAISPIAMTRMVAAAMARHRPRPGPDHDSAAAGSSGRDAGKRSATGGLSLGSMPEPEELGPLAAHLVDDGFDACSGQVLFTAGSEVAVIDRPRPLEVVTSTGGGSLAAVLEEVSATALVPAHEQQHSTGGGNPRFGSALDGMHDAALASSAIGVCAVVADDELLREEVVAALQRRNVTCHRIMAVSSVADLDPTTALGTVLEGSGVVDAVVVAPDDGRTGERGPSEGDPGWRRALDEHAGIVERIRCDAAWARAVADLSAVTGRPVRLVTLTDARTSGGRSRAQASVQLSRASRSATAERVTAFSVGVETPERSAVRPTAELAAHLACSPGATPLSGADLVVADGSIALRSHPRVESSMVFGTPAVPGWFDEVLRGILR